MAEKVVLVLVDGMRPDGMMECGHPFPKTLMERSSYCLKAQTVYPSSTLPCHMSLFHGVDPDRHGILTNTYVPQVRPIQGLFDQVWTATGRSVPFSTHGRSLRDLSRPGHLHTYVCLNENMQENADTKIANLAISYLKEEQPDFLFLYLGDTDETGGHSHGWMSPEYMECLRKAWDCIQRVCENLPEEYILMVTADHGGHDRTHGTRLPEDMTIPMFFCGPRFPAGQEPGASIHQGHLCHRGGACFTFRR